MGLILLFFISKTVESNIFISQEKEVEKGNIFILFSKIERLSRYFLVFLLGLPIWFIFSILITFLIVSLFGSKFGRCFSWYFITKIQE